MDSTNQVLNLNDYDKLYLLMCKWRIIRLFNPLCYAADVTSVEDLEKKVRTNLDDVRQKLPAWSQSQSFKEDIETIKNLIEDSKTVRYENLPSLLGIERNNYKEELGDAGVQMIQKKQLFLRKKIALGRPYSGDVYNAQWMQGHNMVDVVVRFDLGPTQRELFIREAKIMTGLHHDYIMKFYGAVILGSYTDSVGLVVEFFNKGHLEEFRVPSLFHAWLYASQLSSALEYLESKHLVHTSVAEPFVYISSLEKISLGGFMCCYYEEEINKAKQEGQRGNLKLSTITGHQGHRLDDLSVKGVVALFSHVVLSMFRYLDSHRSGQLVNLFPGHRKQPLVCPRGVASLLQRCQVEDFSKRPTFHDIVQTLAKERPEKFCFTTSNSSAEPCELSYDKGEKLWVISQDATRYHGMWFGQKENGTAGFFDGDKVIPIDDDNQGTSPPSYMFTTGREKEREELPKAMRLQERKESAGFQKDPHQKASVASATVGSLVHMGTKDFQTMEDKILSFIQSNYLQTTLQQSAEDRNEFQEYLEKPATGTSPPSDMFTTGREREQKELPKAMRLQERKEFSTRNNKISVSKSEITEEGGALMVQNVPSRVLIPPKALATCTEVTCSLWNQQILSPPLGRNEALVSSVMELACGNLPGTEERYEFNVKVKVALSHSASDIKGYELVIKELTNEKTNDWRDLKTRWAWTPSDIKDEHSGMDEFPDWLFPFAEAEITSFSSFAVVWRLKSFTFKNPSTLSSSFPCILSDHPGVSVTFPESSLPTGQTFALTVQVQEVPCSNAKLKEPPVVGPILHISTSEPVQLLAPARLTIPVTLREDIPKCLDYSATDVRIFCRTSEEDEREWNEVTEQLENIAVLENGTVAFTVNHFSEHWVWIDRLKLPFVTLKNLADDFCRRLMLQEVGFFARLYATENPSIYVLTLFCFPLHLREQVQTLSPDSRRVCAQGGGNSRKPLCKQDWMSVSLSNAFTLQEGNPYNLLKFLGTYPYEGSLRVSISDLSNLQVELYMEEQFNRDTLCTLYFVPTFPDQTSSPRYFPSTAQVAMPEQKEDQVALESSTSFPSPKALEETDSSISSEKVLNVTILADEWNSLKGGLSTFNRELAIHLASRSDTHLTVFVPHGACEEKEKAAAAEKFVSIIEAEELMTCDSLVELFFPPDDLEIDVVIGHGVKLGQQAQKIRKSHKCMWVQVVHTAPAELGMYKGYSNAVTQSGVKNKREVSLCKIADLVMAVGPKLKGFYSTRLHSSKKEQDVMGFTPGIMSDLNGVKLSPNENDEFQVLMFGRGDDEDFELKGYDIAARAFTSHELKNDSYHLTFVGAAPGKEDEFADKILRHKISKNQLSVEEYIKDRDGLKELLLRMDLVIMPSRTEGFGLTALEGLSAGLPVLAGHNSGFSKALQKVKFGEHYVVNSDKPEDWSKAIKKVRQKERKKRLDEMQQLRKSYGQKYNWAEQCEILVKEMRRKVFELQNIDNKPTKTP